jgi:ATP-dependent DNA helicase RecG
VPSIEHIHAWTAGGESEIIEFKRTTGTRREAIQTLCAMLNTRGGRVLIGVDPGGAILGQQVSDHTIEELSQVIREIEPPVFPSIDRVPLDNGNEVLVISVTQGANRPYVVRGAGYRRLGNTTVAMSRDEYNRMLLERLHSDKRWENEAADGWTVQDLDAAEVTRTLEEAIRRGRQGDPGTRDPPAVLRGLGLMRDGVLLRAASVLFGREETIERVLPQCLLRVAKFRGVDKSEFVDSRQFYGNVFRLISQADRFLREHLPIAGRVVANLFERADDPLYPPVALREALANAFCHRDYSIGGGSVAVAVYSDRLEITSSGTLHFGLTTEDLFLDHESLPWNPLLARVFFARGIVERWGRGTQVMAELTQRAGLPLPEIEEASGCVIVRFRPSPHIPREAAQASLTELQRQLLELLGQVGRPLRELRAAQPDRPQWAIKDDLALLKRIGLVDITGHGRGSIWFRRAR